MDDQRDKIVEKEVTEALLDVGVSVPLKEIRIPFKKEPIRLRISLKRPYLGTQMRIDRIYLGMGVTYEEVSAYSREEWSEFRTRHGKEMSRILSLMICRGRLSGLLLSPLVAWFLRWSVEDFYLRAVYERYASLLNTNSFGTIIASVEGSLMTTPMASQDSKKRS